MQIELRQISKKYGAREALRPTSGTIDDGQIIALLGANGSGKSTLLRLLAAVTSPTSGEVLYDGAPFRRDALALRRQIFFLPDFPFVVPEMTVLRHLAMVVRVYEIDETGIEGRLMELLKEFSLLTLAEEPMASLSRGQLYKAAMIGLLLVDPLVWLFDEPFASGMDPNGINAFKRHARSRAERGGTVIFSTQIIEVVEKIADYVCVLNQGEVAIMESVDDLQARGGGDGSAIEKILEPLREV